MKEDNLSPHSGPHSGVIADITNHISSVKKMSKEQELWLFRKDKNKRTQKEIDQLINNNLSMALHLSHKYCIRYNLSVTNNIVDLYHDAIIGLYKAIEKYDAWRNIKFSTFAYFHLENQLRKKCQLILYPLKKQAYADIYRADDIEKPGDLVQIINTKKQYDDNKEYRIDHKELMDALKNYLNDIDYKIFHLIYVKGYSGAEVSQIMKLKVTTIYTYHAKLKKKLKKILKKEF